MLLKLDNELKQVLRTSIPLVVVELVSSLYSLTDTYFVSGLGQEALAGLGISSYILMLFQVFNTLFTIPSIVFTSQGIGGGNKDQAKSAVGEVYLRGLLFIGVLSIIWYIMADDIVKIQSGVKGLTFQYAVSYLKVRVGGFIVLYTTMVLDSIIVASGYTMYSLIANSLGLILNIILDPIMIYGYIGFPPMGVTGAAIATVISNTITLPAQLFYLSKLHLIPRIMLGFNYVRGEIDLGLPAFVERFLFALGNNIYAGIISRLGDAVMAAHNVGLRIESLIYMPGFAFSMTASALVGRYVGQGELSRAKEIGWRTAILGSLLMGLLGVAIGSTGYYLVKPFAPSDEIRYLSSIYLAFAGFSELGLGIAMVISGAFRGAGNTWVPMVTNVVSLICVRVLLSIILVNYLGVIGPWSAMFIDVYVRGVVLAILYKLLFDKLARKVI
ncbi:MAG: MATE family efflux transporter [Desulfurococcaceae archaeon]